MVYHRIDNTSVAPQVHPDNYNRYLPFLKKIGLHFAKDIPTPDKPWICFSNEFGVSDLPAAGGLGYLAGDWILLAGRLGIPFVGVGLYYHTRWRQVLEGNFHQKEHYHHIPHPSHFAFRKLSENSRYVTFLLRSNIHETPIEIFVKEIRGNLLIMLHEPGIKGLYEGEKWDEHRLYQSAVLGFGGVYALGKIGIKPSLLHLNESSTVISALSYLDRLCLEGMRLDEALVKVRKITLFTNHTLSPAAEHHWHPNQVERYILPNIQCNDVREWLKEKIQTSKEGFCFSDLAFELSGKVNAVSRIHGREALKTYGKKFHSITNAVSFRWVFPEIYDKYRSRKILHSKLWLPEPGYRKKLHRMEHARMISVKDQARRKLRTELKKEWYNQYANKIIIPREAKIAVWARRFDDYKRPYLIFSDPNYLAEILERHNIYLILSGRVHPSDRKMKRKLKEILEIIDGNMILKERVRYVVNYGWRIARYLAMGADVWINTPRIGTEACGTSWEKAVLNWALLISTPDGGAADIFEDGTFPLSHTPFLLIEGGNDDREASNSLYRKLAEAGEILEDKLKWKHQVISQLEAYLSTASGPRMMGEYLKLVFKN